MLRRSKSWWCIRRLRPALPSGRAVTGSRSSLAGTEGSRSFQICSAGARRVMATAPVSLEHAEASITVACEQGELLIPRSCWMKSIGWLSTCPAAQLGAPLPVFCPRVEMLQLYERCILMDIEFSDAQNVDQLLWKNAFYQVIEKFRQLLKDPLGENAQDIRIKLLQLLDEVRERIPNSTEALGGTGRCLGWCRWTTSLPGPASISVCFKPCRENVQLGGDLAQQVWVQVDICCNLNQACFGGP